MLCNGEHCEASLYILTYLCLGRCDKCHEIFFVFLKQTLVYGKRT